MSKQIIYHGTNCKVKTPEIIRGRYYKESYPFFLYL